jgi:opacity protein-like surface antigen
MRLLRPVAVALVLLLVSAASAHADATLFVGSTRQPSGRVLKGFALGAGILVVGVEGEFASTNEDTSAGAPSVTTGMGNVLVQTPIPLAGLQFYATTGAGVYRERLGTTHQETNVGVNTGGGVKISLFGPLKVRVDYRVFRLQGSPIHKTPQRVYVGLNLGF